ncbi:MAG TPA: glycosyltransferase family 1 protein [Candidatus Babeliaceae bacterium]|nr:glycosyltransferase family 1 protein [Candidatus Babeliaceae bacterium]
MKEICIDVRMAFHGGIGTYIRNIVPRLTGFRLHLLTNRHVLEKWPFLNQSSVILTSAPIYSIEEQMKIPFLVPRCDLFWTPHYNTPVFSLRAKKRLTTIHDVNHLIFGKIHKLLYAKVVIQRAIKVSDHLLTISNFSKSELIKYAKAPTEKISTLHLGVDTTHFSRWSDERLSKIREKYKLPQNYFLFVSTLAPHKNVARLLSAWHLFSQEFTDWKLVLVGKSKEKLPPSGTILFLGHVEEEDLPALYQLAYASVHPSLYEGFGLTPLESMSSGCPAVVSKAASLPEVCGDCAVYIDPCQIEDIAQGMRLMVQDKSLYARLREKGLEWVSRFNWDKTVEGHAEILERLT